MAVPEHTGQDADAKSQTCLDPVRRPVAQPSVQASREASLEIQRAQAAGRPCYEAERTPLAAENSVGEPAANWRLMSATGKESVAHSHPPSGPCLAARPGRGFLFSGFDASGQVHQSVSTLVLLNRLRCAANLRPVQKTILLFAALTLISVCTTACRKEPGPPSVSGTIETDEVHVASRYGGRVERIFAWEGDVLTNGQLIAELDAAELRA